jgi:signal transduction histidine kinase
VRKDGEKIWVSLNGKLIRGPDGEVAYFQEFAEDISGRRHAEEKLNAAHQKMRNLAAYLLKSREEERRTIAQEVHDQVGQQLAALKMDIHWLSKHLHGTSVALDQRVNGMMDLCEEAIGMVQRIASELRPRMLDDLGLAPALQQLGADFTRHTGIPCTVSTSFPARLVGGNAATALYRLTQEALANVRRHSQAHHAGVRLSLEKADLVLQIKDDGKGITCEQAEAPDSYGLIGLRERVAGLGGHLSIQGQPGKGTILTASIPLPEEGGLA